jgi:hypothetical protein
MYTFLWKVMWKRRERTLMYDDPADQPEDAQQDASHVAQQQDI